MHQDLGLKAFGAKLIQPQMWNPFCQAYEDKTKGSLLAPPGKEHNHCNLGLLSISRGGDLRPFKEASWTKVETYMFFVLRLLVSKPFEYV